MVKIRKFSLNDLNKVLALARDVYGWHDINLCGEELKLMREELLRIHARDTVASFVAEDGSQIIGMCFGEVQPQNKAIGQLHYVGVDPRIQSRGIGSKLVKRAISHLKKRNVKEIFLGTDRPKAIPFYLKHDFNMVGYVMSVNLGRNGVAKNDKSAQLQKIVEEYTGFKFSFRNETLLRESINEVLKQNNISEKKRVSQLIAIMQSYNCTQPAQANLPDARRKIECILISPAAKDKVLQKKGKK